MRQARKQEKTSVGRVRSEEQYYRRRGQGFTVLRDQEHNLELSPEGKRKPGENYIRFVL